MQVSHNGKIYAIDFKDNQATPGRRALILTDKNGTVEYVATVNIPEEPLGKKEVIIKDYSENEGIQASLIKAGVIKPTGRSVDTGFVTCDICEVLI